MNTERHIASAFDRDLEGIHALLAQESGLAEAALAGACAGRARATRVGVTLVLTRELVVTAGAFGASGAMLGVGLTGWTVLAAIWAGDGVAAGTVCTGTGLVEATVASPFWFIR